MAITIVKTLTDNNSSATYSSAAEWEAVHGDCGGGHPNVQSYTIVADGTNSVVLTRVFASEEDWNNASNANSEDRAEINHSTSLVSDSRASE